MTTTTVSLETVLNDKTYAAVKDNVKDVLAKRLSSYAAHITLTKVNSDTLRVVAAGKVKGHLSLAADIKTDGKVAMGSIAFTTIGSSAQLLKVGGKVTPTPKAKAAKAVRTGWSFTVLLSMIVSLSAVLNVAMAFM